MKSEKRCPAKGCRSRVEVPGRPCPLHKCEAEGEGNRCVRCRGHAGHHQREDGKSWFVMVYMDARAKVEIYG